jgi:hypothetical protein
LVSPVLVLLFSVLFLEMFWRAVAFDGVALITCLIGIVVALVFSISFIIRGINESPTALLIPRNGLSLSVELMSWPYEKKKLFTEENVGETNEIETIDINDKDKVKNNFLMFLPCIKL